MKKRGTIIKLIISVLSLLVIIGLYAGIVTYANKAHTIKKNVENTADDFRISNETSSKILQASKELTNNSLSFIATGNPRYVALYYEEVYGTKSRDTNIEIMRQFIYKYKINSVNYYEPLGISQAIQNVERHAMTLACYAYGIDFKAISGYDVEPYELTSQEMALSPLEAINAAGAMLEAPDYLAQAGAANGLWTKNNGMIISAINVVKNNYSDAESKNLVKERNLVNITGILDILLFLFVTVIIVIPLMKKNNDLSVEKEYIKDYDKLTGALNFNSFQEKVLKLFRDHPHRRYLIWYGDIKNFKYVNQTAGFEAGDEILKTLVELYNSITAKEDFICRIGGNSFTGVINVDNRFNSVFKILRRKYSKFIKEKCPGIQSDVYVGVYQVKDMITVKEMVENAQFAMNVIKGTNKYFEIYTNELKNSGARRVDICKSLDESLSNGSISVYLQPQYDSNRNITGAEALCRWNHKKMGFISPGEFIPILEDENLITKLDKFVWEETCKTLAKWKNNPEYKLVPISINVSRIDIEQINVIEILEALCAKYEIESSLIRVEITESAYADDETNIINFTATLRSKGFIVEMDDFGSGYSSLNMLKSYPLNVCKLDLKFLDDNSQNEKSQIVISSVIDMVKKLGIDVVAEGVETEDQFEILKGYGCDCFQGFLLSKPIPIDKFEEINK